MKNALLWQFKTDEVSSPSVICGTIHLGTPSAMAHWQQMSSLAMSYNRIFTESSLDESDLQYLKPFTLLPEGQNRKDFLSERRWQKMRKVFLKYCELDINMLAMFRPLFIIAQLQSNLLQEPSDIPLDHRIWNLAIQEGKVARGIETPQEQVRILVSLDMAQQYRQLVKMSRNISNTRRKLHQLLAAYKDQDIKKLYKMSKGTLGKDKSILIKDRNKIIADRIMKWHVEEPSFFSFGAGHLAGGNGVLRALKHAGAAIEPVDLSHNASIRG